MSAFSKDELRLIEVAHNDQRIWSVKFSGILAMLGIVCGITLLAFSLWHEDITAWAWIAAIFVTASFAFAYALARTRLTAYSLVSKLTPEEYKPEKPKLVPYDGARLWAICAAVGFWVALTLKLGIDDLCDEQALFCQDTALFRQLLASPILILGGLWGIADSRRRGVEFSSLLALGFVFLLPVAAPTYVVKTRGWKGAAMWLLKIFGCLVLVAAIFFVGRRVGLWPYGLS